MVHDLGRQALTSYKYRLRINLLDLNPKILTNKSIQKELIKHIVNNIDY